MPGEEAGLRLRAVWPWPYCTSTRLSMQPILGEASSVHAALSLSWGFAVKTSDGEEEGHGEEDWETRRAS